MADRGTITRRSAAILDMLYRSKEPMRIQAIAESMGCVRERIYPLVVALCEAGLIESKAIDSNGSPHVYVLGSKLIQLGAEAVRRRRAAEGSAA